MSLQSWVETLHVGTTDGPALTAAAAASCIPTASRLALFNPGFFTIGKAIRIAMSGRISCVVTTPGTGRLDIRLGAAGNTIVFDTGALNLNIVAKVNVPWEFEVDLICRAVGITAATTFFPRGGAFRSEAVVGSPLPAAGGNGSLIGPVGAPAVGAGTDNTVLHILDVFFTQTVATGSFQVHNFMVQALN